ncbi:unnamed protein product [Allacma fusca]|uniref:Uncharacterized protein n=1 Tax=Allacma fusca TaxID=39272 RepID=A0A8J2KQC0_9HEXA|nr:unnamed protein product [Allacma fusca]
MANHLSLKFLFTSSTIYLIYTTTLTKAIWLLKGPKLGTPCDVGFYTKYTLPIQIAKGITEQHEAEVEFNKNAHRYAQQSCHTILYDSLDGKTTFGSEAFPVYYRCDPQTKTCICNDVAPFDQIPNASDPTGCTSAPLKPGDTCDYAYASQVENNYFSGIYGNKRFKGNRTTKYDIAFYHVEYAKFRNEHLEKRLMAANTRRICAEVNFRTMRCNSDNKCECLNDGDNFHFKQVGDECVGEEGTICEIDFLGSHTHQNITCAPEHPCELAKIFYKDYDRNDTDENFIIKACGGLWGEEDSKDDDGWRITHDKILLFSALIMLSLVSTSTSTSTFVNCLGLGLWFTRASQRYSVSVSKLNFKKTFVNCSTFDISPIEPRLSPRATMYISICGRRIH